MICMKMAASTGAFRNSFKISKDKLNWYPGHMGSSLKHMQAKMRKVDCVIEVHDSRIPFSGRNQKFLWNLIGSKPHILVLNKKDLINKKNLKAIEEKCYEENCSKVVFTNCLNSKCSGLNNITALILELIQKDITYSYVKSDLRVMVVGIPNVGKSSLINALRNINLARGKATAVGSAAGVTKSVQNEIKISVDPPVFIIDTPGILMPNITDLESGMKLALCSCLNDNVVGINFIADFLLYWMNKTGNFIYVKYFDLSQPVDNIFPLLLKIAVDNKFFSRRKNLVTNSVDKIPDTDSAASLMVNLFRKGKFGDIELDRNYFMSSYCTL